MSPVLLLVFYNDAHVVYCYEADAFLQLQNLSVRIYGVHDSAAVANEVVDELFGFRCQVEVM